MVYTIIYLFAPFGTPYINDLSFLRGRFAVRRTVRALQKRSTVTYLSTNESIYNVVQNLSENACCVGG